MKAHTLLAVSSAIPNGTRMTQKNSRAWLVEQPADPHHGNDQAVTWLKIENGGASKKINVRVKWATFTQGYSRNVGYQKINGKFGVIFGSVGPRETEFDFIVPRGVSFFGNFPWYDLEDSRRFVHKLAESPHAGIRILGRSRDGREIHCVQLGIKKSNPNVLILAREHANETGGSFAMEAIGEYLNGSGRSLLKKYNFQLVPVANPDGVAHGRKYPQFGPIALSDLHYAGRTSKDPTCRVMRDFQKKARPAAIITFHGYLFSVPQIITYENEDLKHILDALIADTGPKDPFMWYIKRSEEVGNRDKSMLRYCHHYFRSLINLVELPWAGRSISEMRSLGLQACLATMTALQKRSVAEQKIGGPTIPGTRTVYGPAPRFPRIKG